MVSYLKGIGACPRQIGRCLMISVEEALERILAEIVPLTVTQVPLPEALGLVLAEDVIAQEDMPPFANSAMDGYALLSQDSQPRDGQPPRLPITGEVAAGYVADHALEPGTAMRIMTGAPVPPGADTVIQVELTRSEGPEWVEILQAVPPGNNIRPAGKTCTVAKQSWYMERRLGHGKLACWQRWVGQKYQ